MNNKKEREVADTVVTQSKAPVEKRRFTPFNPLKSCLKRITLKKSFK